MLTRSLEISSSCYQSGKKTLDESKQMLLPNAIKHLLQNGFMLHETVSHGGSRPLITHSSYVKRKFLPLWITPNSWKTLKQAKVEVNGIIPLKCTHALQMIQMHFVFAKSPPDTEIRNPFLCVVRRLHETGVFCPLHSLFSSIYDL